MANEQSGVKFFVIYTVVTVLMFPCNCYGKEEEEGENPLLEIAQSLAQESVRNQNGGLGLNILRGLVAGFMQSEEGNQIKNILVGDQRGGSGGAELISNLVSLWQAAKAANNGDSENAREESGFDPSIVGTVIDLIGTMNKGSNDASNDNNKEGHKTGAEDQKEEEGSIDWEGVINLMGNFLSSMGSNQGNSRGNGGLESLLSFLPVLLSSLSGQHNIHASKSIPHHSHEQFLPPILENLHEYWDHFSNSKFGKTLWENSGLSALAKLFTDSKGMFDVDKIFKSLENNSFRRMWVKSTSNFVAQWVKHFTDPDVQGKYLESVQLVVNSFLKAQGYPRDSHIDLHRPAESISNLANSVFKRQFNLDVNSETYVKPVVSYIQEIFRLGQKRGYGFSKLSTQDIETRLAETLDTEIIESILRVNRAFKFGRNRKQCAKYVICAINQPQESNKTGLKPGVTKLASMAASWFLSNNNYYEYWDLYFAAVEGKGCAKYDNMCSEFHSEDLKATTEYYHNEL